MNNGIIGKLQIKCKVQGYGRSIRSKEDWAKTYALYTAFGYFVRKIGICYDPFLVWL
jgi:hypothetical protein